MTTQPEAVEGMAKAFVDGWTAAYPSYPYVLDNDVLRTPTDTPWARLSVRHADGQQDSLGGVGVRKFLRTGTVFVNVYTRTQNANAGGGSAQAIGIARTVANFFEGKTLQPSTVWFAGVIVRELGPSGKWYQVSVEATFNYQETK